MLRARRRRNQQRRISKGRNSNNDDENVSRTLVEKIKRVHNAGARSEGSDSSGYSGQVVMTNLLSF